MAVVVIGLIKFDVVDFFIVGVVVAVVSVGFIVGVERGEREREI